MVGLFEIWCLQVKNAKMWSKSCKPCHLSRIEMLYMKNASFMFGFVQPKHKATVVKIPAQRSLNAVVMTQRFSIITQHAQYVTVCILAGLGMSYLYMFVFSCRCPLQWLSRGHNNNFIQRLYSGANMAGVQSYNHLNFR